MDDEFSENDGGFEETSSSDTSVNDLYDEGQQEAADAQADALSWAEDQGMDEWSNGDPIQHSEGYEPPADTEDTDDSTDGVPEEPDSTDEVPEEPDSTDETPEEPDSTDEATEEPDNSDEQLSDAELIQQKRGISQDADTMPDYEHPQDAEDWDSLSDIEKINRLSGREEADEEGFASSEADAVDALPPEGADEDDSKNGFIKDDDNVRELEYGYSEEEIQEEQIKDDTSYGNSGDGSREHIDPNATFEDSHFNETNEGYHDPDAEETERANLEGERNLKRQEEIDEENAEAEEQEEREQEEQERAEREEQERAEREEQERAEREEQERAEREEQERVEREEQERAEREKQERLEQEEQQREEEELAEQQRQEDELAEQQRQEEELAEQQRQEEETKEQQERSLQDIIREKRGISSNSDSTSVEKRNINPYMRYRGRDGR